MTTFTPGDPAYMDYIKAVAAKPVFHDTLGLRVDEIAPGRIVAHIDAGPGACHEPNWFQGAITSALGDVVASFACATLPAPGWSTRVLEFSVKYVGAARGERLIGRGQVLRAGKSISVAQSEVFAVDNGRETLCAIASLTCHHIATKKT